MRTMRETMRCNATELEMPKCKDAGGKRSDATDRGSRASVGIVHERKFFKWRWDWWRRIQKRSESLARVSRWNKISHVCAEVPYGAVFWKFCQERWRCWLPYRATVAIRCKLGSKRNPQHTCDEESTRISNMHKPKGNWEWLMTLLTEPSSIGRRVNGWWAKEKWSQAHRKHQETQSNIGAIISGSINLELSSFIGMK